MLEKSYAKINLRLKVVGINDNGYHLLQMVNTKVNFYDILKFKKTKKKEINVYMKEVKQEENLVYSVASYMFNKYNLPGGLDIKIKKNIMIGAGLAGGSANAASTINVIDKLYKLNLNINEKRDIASLFGTDIIYCLDNYPALFEGIGEVIHPFNLSDKKNVLIINPNIKISTKDIYNQYDALYEYSKPLDKDTLESFDLKSLLENDLEQVVFTSYPQILNLKKQILEYSPNVLMSGSGSTIYVIDEKKILKKIYKEMKKTYPEYKYVLTKTR